MDRGLVLSYSLEALILEGSAVNKELLNLDRSALLSAISFQILQGSLEQQTNYLIFKLLENSLPQNAELALEIKKNAVRFRRMNRKGQN